MIPIEVAVLRDILLSDPNVTNSESQATRWACKIIERLQEDGWTLERSSADAESR